MNTFITSHWRAILPIVAISAVIALIAICDIIVIYNARGRTSSDVDVMPHCGSAILLGTSPLTVRHTRNVSFHNRIKAAATLFHSGKIDRIIASGGDYSHFGGCDEPESMARCLVEAGVPRDSIVLDYDGQRTILSLKNAKEKYHLDSVIVISQKYHCERALFQADHFGLQATGFNADNTSVFVDWARNWGRERLARVKLMIDMLTEKEQ